MAESQERANKPSSLNEAARAEQIKRIQVQSRTGLNEQSSAFWNQLDLPRMDVILEGACGPGMELGVLSEYTDHIIAIDNDPQSFEAARKVVAALDLEERVTLQQSSVEQLGLPDASVDAVNARLLFEHLPKALRQQTMQEFIRVLKPNGVVVAEDFTARTWLMHPKCEAFDQLVDLTVQNYRRKKAEPEMGYKLPEFFEKHDLKDLVINISPHVSRGPHPFFLAHLSMLGTQGREMVEAGEITEKELQALMAGVKKAIFENEEEGIFRTGVIIATPLMTRIAGWKK